MRRRLARPFGHTVPQSRALSLLMALAVIGLIYHRAKEPQLWSWLTNESRADALDDAPAEKPAPKASSDAKANSPKADVADKENLVPGPNETDADELLKLRTNLKAVQDRVPLQDFDMSAYWQLMRWSRTRPMAELEKLAQRDVPLTQLWEEPNLYRGQPIRLKLRVRRVLQHQPKKNPQDLKIVYEAWGPTEESRSYPYCVVFPDKPAGLPIGTDVDEDIVFVGYFLKWMSYQAFDAKKYAPVLIGRARPVTRTAGAAKSGGWESAFLTLVGGVLLLSFIGWFAIYGLRRPRTIAAATTAIPEKLPENWLADASAEASPGPTAKSLDFVNVAPTVADETPIGLPPTASAMPVESTPGTVS